MSRFLWAALAVACTCLAGCSGSLPGKAETALRNGQNFELFSLDPSTEHEGVKPNNFHRWEILGSTHIASAATREELIAALEQGLAENNNMVAGCFVPRHGIRVDYDGSVYDFVICFECLQVSWYIDDAFQGQLLTSDSPLPVFNEVLRQAQVSLPASAESGP